MHVGLLQYGHLRYKFPEQQIYPHSSFSEEAAYISEFMGAQPASTGDTFFGEVSQQVLGPQEGCCWYMLAVDRLSQQVSLPPAPMISPSGDGDNVFEIAMEGISTDVRERFGYNSAGPYTRAVAQQMTLMSGLADALPGVAIDDWAFEPCGYSMNGLRDGFYYTVHVTPEPAFSYSSFETNDPRYCDPQWLSRIVAIFDPRVVVISFTGRGVQPEMFMNSITGFELSHFEVQPLGRSASVCCVNFDKAK